MQISERIENIRRSQAELQQEQALLEMLPPGLDVGTMFRLHGRWHINLKGDLMAALHALPPANAKMVLTDGSWIAAPEAAELNWEQRVLGLVKSSSGVSWYHYLGDECVTIKMEGASLPSLPGYIVNHTVHTEVLVRKPVDVGVLASSPEEQDQAAWDAFYVAEGYQERHKQFARVLHIAARRNRAVTFDMLPERPAETLEVAGKTLEIRYAAGGAPAEVLPPHSELFAFPRIGRFWHHFTEEQARRLLDFAASQRKDLEEIQNAAAKAGIQRALQSLSEFESTFLQAPLADALDDEVVTRWVQEKTGLPVSVSLRSSLYRSYGNEREVWVHLWRFNEGAKLKLPSAVYDPAGFSFQNPSFYQYEENAGRF